MMAVVAEGNNGRIYLSPDNKQISEARVTLIGDYVHGAMPENPRWFSPPAFGLKDFEMLFTNRQLAALTTFSDLVEKAQQKVEADAIAAGLIISQSGKHRFAGRKAAARKKESSKTHKESGNSPCENSSYIIGLEAQPQY